MRLSLSTVSALVRLASDPVSLSFAAASTALQNATSSKRKRSTRSVSVATSVASEAQGRADRKASTRRAAKKAPASKKRVSTSRFTFASCHY